MENYTKEKQGDFNDTSKVGVKTILSVYLNAYVELSILSGDVSSITNNTDPSADDFYKFINEYKTYGIPKTITELLGKTDATETTVRTEVTNILNKESSTSYQSAESSPACEALKTYEIGLVTDPNDRIVECSSTWEGVDASQLLY